MLQLVTENDPILTRVCEPCDFADPAFDPQEFASAMTTTMRVYSGAGLAAPQVGVAKRFFVIGDDGFALACFNPEIVETSPELLRRDEGCLSFPHLWLKIDRPQWVVGRYMTANGTVTEQRFFNLFARCFCHEIDHLNGICFTKYIGPLGLKTATTRRKKFLKEEYERQRV